jgi:hypothetical protein
VHDDTLVRLGLAVLTDTTLPRLGLQGVHGLGGGGIGHTSAMMISFTTFLALHQTFLQSFSASNFPRTTTTFFFLSSNSTFSMQNSSASNEKQKTIDWSIYCCMYRSEFSLV